MEGNSSLLSLHTLDITTWSPMNQVPNFKQKYINGYVKVSPTPAFVGGGFSSTFNYFPIFSFLFRLDQQFNRTIRYKYEYKIYIFVAVKQTLQRKSLRISFQFRQYHKYLRTFGSLRSSLIVDDNPGNT